MEKTEPTFVPEWLKSNGSQSSSSHSDEQGASKATRNKSFVSIGDNDLGRPSVLDRTTSSYFRRTSSSNGSSHLRSYSSFGRKDNRHHDFSDPLGNILPSRFEKEVIRRSHSSVSAKRGDSWPRKVVADSSNGNVLRSKTVFERDFPSLGAEEKQSDGEIGRVPSPGLTSAIQSLPIGNSPLIGGDGWTSALAEVPVIVGSNGNNTPVLQPVPLTISGRNMAETLAHGPPRAQTAPQLSVGTQRLVELAVKQSRQLIPMTPSMPKALALSSLDKAKPKVVGQLQAQSSPRPVSTKFDVPKTSTVGKLHVLKPSRERNGVTPIAKDNLSPTGGSKLPNSPLAVPLVVGSAPLRNPGNNAAVATLEKRPSPQARSRNDFFNLMRKKSMTNSSSPVTPDNTGSSISATDKPSEAEVRTVTTGGHDPMAVDGSAVIQRSSGTGVDEKYSTNNGKNNSSSDAILYSEEEEARFLRSLGWEETGEEEEGLTEEEINSFYRDASKYLNLPAASKIFKGTQPKLLMGNNGDISSGSKLES